VAISGDSVIVGAPLNDPDVWPLDQGSAYVFVRSGTTWTRQDHLIIVSYNLAGDNFGWRVAISGDTAVVGAVYEDVAGHIDQGSAHVFVRSGTIWMDQADLVASDGEASDFFGLSVAADGDSAVVGSAFSAYVYEGTSPTQTPTPTPTPTLAPTPTPPSTPTPSPSPTLSPTPTGEGEAQVSATVTLQSISVTIAEGYPTAMDYGVMAPGTEAIPATYTPGTYSYLRVENNGSVAEDLLIKGADATCGTGTWTLAATPGANQYSHLYGIGQSPVSYTPLSTSASTLGSNVAAGGTVDFKLKIQTPTSSTVYGQYSTTVTILAVAH
jgi:hypothetical protein